MKVAFLFVAVGGYSDDSGILDGAVTLNQVTSTPQNDDKRREEMKSLGGKIC